ncbi:MAG TPA: YicC family protein [Firmicutes bacterium]|nr:YicC family protein [Bacillota bacterium]
MGRSMTGWGTYRTTGYTINIRGLNSKFREVLVHLPQEFFGAEPYIHKYISEKISRGRVDVYVNIDKSNIRKKIRLNTPLFKSAYKSFEKMFLEAGIKEKVPAEMIINSIDGIVAVENAGDLKEFRWERIKPHIDRALNDFIKMKDAEGAKLAKDIIKRAGIIKKEAREIRSRFLVFKKEYAENTLEKLEKLMDRENRKKYLSTDIVEALDKHNITEELVRINSHLSQLETIVRDKGPNGRKIDFMAQELYREANTISSKISDPAVAHSVIAIKENTEKIREQSMNLE